MTGDRAQLIKLVDESRTLANVHFDVEVGRILLGLSSSDHEETFASIDRVRKSLTMNLSLSEASSLQNCHETMLRLHALTEIELIRRNTPNDKDKCVFDLTARLERRLNAVGPFVPDKQYLLGIRRAAMQSLGYVKGQRQAYLADNSLGIYTPRVKLRQIGWPAVD